MWMLSVNAFIATMLPFVLIVAAGILVRKRGNPETAGRRTFLFLLLTSAVLWAAILINTWLSPHSYGFALLPAPMTSGIMALILLNLDDVPGLSRRVKLLLLLALLLLLGLATMPLWAAVMQGDLSQVEMVFIATAAVANAGLLATVWTLSRRHPAALALAAVGSLALFLGWSIAQLALPAERAPAWVSVLSAAVYIALPTLVVATVATLAATGLKLTRSPNRTEPPSRREMLGRLALAVVVLGAFLYTFAWAWLWDGTDDGLRGLVMITVSSMTATAAALVLALTSAGWRRWVGVAFPVLLLALMQGTASRAWQDVENPTRHVTEERAGRIQEAVESYKEESGRYPGELADLVPGEMWWIPRPMILPAEEWCYQGGADYYRLGAIYKEHWSAPSITVRVYASAGTPPETEWHCDEKLAELQPHYDMVGSGTGPTPEPLPTSAGPAGRTAIQPAISAQSLTVGDWSPDSAYLIFGLTQYVDAQTEIDLHFLDAATGEVCRASQPEWTAGERSDGLREHFAWLPDRRLLYVSEGGEMVAMTPCADDVEALAGRYPVTFTGAASFDPQSEHILLKSEDGYWLMDGRSLEVKEIPDIRLTGLESPWTWYDWSPGSERLAISLLDELETSTSATLYIVNVAAAEVEKNLPLADASMTNIPVVEWLTPEKLLVHSGLLEVDIGSDPPQTTDLLQDVFLLDLAYPMDFSSMDSLSNPAGEGYYVGVRANHPRNQAVYLYTSETAEVEVFEHDTHTLLFFPDGEWMALPQWEDDPSYRDEYELVWIERPGETERLTVEGHTPRDHPQIFPRYLPALSQLAVSSSQGVSLVSIPDGEMVAFWELAGGSGSGIRIVPSPDGKALAVVASGVGLYQISLPASD